MGEEGEKTCPLCAEEMDLTDQQLKPCKCGYEICVWCWHHIMEMAEKDESEGRCPACRSPYDKDKIVGSAASCERLVTELNTEKKVKSNKGKSKTSEGRKQLSSVRVIQRNLVYIVGLPLNLADEDLLQRKEYFGQYGKVLKVSISRSTSGAIQHFANNTCSVYITYLKEEEAFRCIQSVHGFVLEGRSLRACYGTTKYCHSWLRNLPCSNPDCLYLHETGLQEDSFSKDELISAYTRNKVQQVTGAIDSTQRRYGSALPPPADDYCSRTSTNSLPGSMKVSPPSSSCGRSAALPAGASWGMRASSNPPTSGSLSSSNGPHKQKVESINGSITFSAVLASSNPMLLPKKDNFKEKSTSREESKPTVKLGKESINNDCHTDSSDKPVISGSDNSACTSSKGGRSSGDKYADPSANTIKSDSVLSASCEPGQVEWQKDISNEKINKTCSDVTSMSFDRHLGLEEGSYQEKIGLEEGCLKQCKVFDTSLSAAKTDVCDSKILDSGTKFDNGLVSEASGAVVALSEAKSDVLSFDEQRLKDPEFVSSVDYLTNFSGSIHLKSNVRSYPGQLNSTSSLEDLQTVNKRVDSLPHTSGTPALLNGYPENNFSSSAALSRNTEHSYSYQRDEKTKNLGRFENEGVSTGCNGASDIGEDSIISNILSLDIDSWDESLTSPQNLAKFLGEIDRQKDSLKVSSPWKLHQSNQSRFSFAREESADLAPDTESAKMEQAFRARSFGHGINLDKPGSQHGEERDFYSNIRSDFSSSKLSVSRPQVSAPPGFLTPGRAPPPGFAAQERIEQQISNSLCGNYQIGASSLLRNHYQVPMAGNAVSDADVEFIDPAILAVGKGRLADGLNNSPGLDMMSSFSPQLRTFESDAKFQLLMQRSTQQNHRFEVGDSFSMFGDSFNFQPSVVEQSLVNNISQFSHVGLSPHSRTSWPSNGHWDSWKEVQGGNNLGMPELNRERLGFNKFYNGYEESKLHMPNQSDIYGRHFGI